MSHAAHVADNLAIATVAPLTQDAYHDLYRRA
jgi:hypothetical protein